MIQAPGAVTDVGGQGMDWTRGENPEAVRFFDSIMNEQESDLQEQTMLANQETDEAADVQLIELEPDNPIDLHMTPSSVARQTEVTPPRETRAGEVDLNGPYGPVNEGECILFTATVTDPTLVLFRFDWNNDGVMDTDWDISMTGVYEIEHCFGDNYYGDVVVEAWDGFSTQTFFESGTIWDDQWVNWLYGGRTYWNWGWRFQVLWDDLYITRLAAWRWNSFYHPYIYAVALWDDNQNLLSVCDPNPIGNYKWNWCDLPSKVPLVAGDYYTVSMHHYGYRFVYQKGWFWPDDAPVDYEGSYYYASSALRFPRYLISRVWVAAVDFEWEHSYEVPDTYSDGAFTEVLNVAPDVFNAHPSVSVGYEGSEVSFIGEFDDPGFDDTWKYRWIFGDGITSDWFDVQKYWGGANLLILHSWNVQISSILPVIEEACGNFCVSIEDWNFSPQTTNEAPSLDYMLQFDVILVGANYFATPTVAKQVGDRLADYMDAGGNVVTSWGILDPRILPADSRFIEEEYTPMPQNYVYYSSVTLGMVYIPGHPILEGVGAVSVTWHHSGFDTTDGAIRIADWSDGRLAIAEKENPIVPNGALAVATTLWPTPTYSSGDFARLTVNAIKYASQQPDPWMKEMPIETDPVSHIYVDDNPVTTSPQDDFTVTLEIKDDDHERLHGEYVTKLFADFEDCSYPGWPPGWYAIPSTGWRCVPSPSGDLPGKVAANWYNYGSWLGFWATLYAPSINMADKPYIQAYIRWDHSWRANFGNFQQDGYVQISIDGGITWQTLIEFHHQDPGYEVASYELPMHFAAGEPDVRLRLQIYQRYDWWWEVDNVEIEGAYGIVIDGLGTDDTMVTIANVAPSAHMGPTSGLMDESGIFEFVGYKITDPALWEPTEWFAYRWDFDDGTGTDWIYKGSLAPPKLDILVLNSFYVDTGAKNRFNSALEPLDLIGNIVYWDFIMTLQAPTFDYMMQFDIIIFLTWYGYSDTYPPWMAVRRTIGNYMADYVDANRGGVMTLMCTYCTPEHWAIKGRYADEDYGPFEKGAYTWAANQLGEVYYPDHQVMKDKYIITDVGTTGYDGNLKSTDGAIRLASWQAGNGAFAGVKEHANGARTLHYGGAAHTYTGQFSGLLRNSIAWLYAAGIPNDDIYPEYHQYGDNGIYYADIILIDDDMGWTWDIGANMPVADPLYVQSETHYIIPVEVNNVDPLLYPASIEVYIAAEFCLRVSGTAWHTVTLSTYMDEAYFGGVSITREPGDPNDQEKCTMLKIDMMAEHVYGYDLQWSAFPGVDDGGSNPSWIIISPWREPISPGHGTVTYKHDFRANEPVGWYQAMDLPTIEADLLAEGKGAKIGVEATAFDMGTDDLAFLWVWGDSTPYGIHVHHNDGSGWTEGIDTDPESVGFSDPWFDKAANDIRSPHGTVNFMAHDVNYHAFEMGYYYYITLIVMDDDVNEDYPSPFGHAGIDMEFINLDLTGY